MVGRSDGGKSLMETIRVGVRIRPLMPAEKGQLQAIRVHGPKLFIEERSGKTQGFEFDAVIDSRNPGDPGYGAQEDVYEQFGKRMVDHAFNGYTSTIFAYGQTGSGKTTTIMGKASPSSERGLMLRLIRDIFRRAEEEKAKGARTRFWVQMLEIYNEQIRDLLSTPASPGAEGEKKKPEVHVHPRLGVYVTDAIESAVEKEEEALQLLEYGNAMKAVAATAMNRNSSRAHTIFKLRVERAGGADASSVSSDIYCVDLAGRENEKTAQVTGQRLVELSFINRSLMWLAACITSASNDSQAEKKAKASYDTPKMRFNGGRAQVEVGRQDSSPKSTASGGASRSNALAKFRNSKLTLLLANALSGNSRTAMIATVAPPALHFEESNCTLQLAARVKNIKLNVCCNAQIDKDQLVRMLQEEVRLLKEQLRNTQGCSEQAAILQEESYLAVKLVQQHGTSWEENRRSSIAQMGIREETLRQLNIARWVDASSYSDGGETQIVRRPRFPCLVNESDDPHLSGVVVYHVTPREKPYSIGWQTGCDFMLPVSEQMQSKCPKVCTLESKGGKLFVRRTTTRPAVLREEPEGDEDGDDDSSSSSSSSDEAPLFGKAASMPAKAVHRHISEMVKDFGLSSDICKVNGVNIADLVGSSGSAELFHGDRLLFGSLLFRVRMRAEPWPPSEPSEIVGCTTSSASATETGAGAVSGRRRTIAVMGSESNSTYRTGRRGSTASSVSFALTRKRLSSSATSSTVTVAPAPASARTEASAPAAMALGTPLRDVALLAKAAEEERYIKEANEITLAVKGDHGLFFQLAALTPLPLSLNGAQSPQVEPNTAGRELAVQLLQITDADQSANGEHDDIGAPGSAKEGLASSNTILLTVWTLEKFHGRLPLMRDAHQSMMEDPDRFSLDPILDPWAEHGPAELHDLRDRQRQALAAALKAQRQTASPTKLRLPVATVTERGLGSVSPSPGASGNTKRAGPSAAATGPPSRSSSASSSQMNTSSFVWANSPTSARGQGSPSGRLRAQCGAERQKCGRSTASLAKLLSDAAAAASQPDCGGSAELLKLRQVFEESRRHADVAEGQEEGDVDKVQISDYLMQRLKALMRKGEAVADPMPRDLKLQCEALRGSLQAMRDRLSSEASHREESRPSWHNSDVDSWMRSVERLANDIGQVGPPTTVATTASVGASTIGSCVCNAVMEPIATEPIACWPPGIRWSSSWHGICARDAAAGVVSASPVPVAAAFGSSGAPGRVCRETSGAWAAPTPVSPSSSPFVEPVASGTPRSTPVSSVSPMFAGYRQATPQPRCSSPLHGPPVAVVSPRAATAAATAAAAAALRACGVSSPAATPRGYHHAPVAVVGSRDGTVSGSPRRMRSFAVQHQLLPAR